jgi:xylulokinase
MRFLVIDCGTSSCRAAVISGQGKILSQSRQPVTIKHPEPTFAEINTDHLWHQVQKLIQSETKKHPGIRFDAIGVSAMLGYVFLGASGDPLMPAIIYSDNRATVESKEIRQLISDDAFYAITGRQISPFLLAPKIKWLEKNRPDLFTRLNSIIGLKDDIVRRLTGRIQTDITHLDYSGLYDVRQSRFAPDLLDTLGIKKHLFPPSTSPFAMAGTVIKGYGDSGLIPGTPVITGSTDGTTAMYGAGILEKRNAVLVSGTTDVLMQLSDTAIKDDSRTLNLNSGILPNTFLVGGPLGASGGTLNHFEAMLNTSAEKLEIEIDKLPPGAEGLLFFPGLTGERSPYWKEHLTGGIVGLTFAHKAPHILRAIMEGCALRLERLLEIFVKNGLNPHTLTVAGGGANSHTWNQIRCDATGLNVIIPAVSEATCLGTALFCKSGLDATTAPAEISRKWQTEKKRYAPCNRHTRTYRQLAAIFNDYIETNGDIYQRLTDFKIQNNPHEKRRT